MPLAKLMLRCGLGCSEFVAIAKVVFVQAATDEYGLRGRPTNISRVAAMTGLSRKEVRKIRNDGLNTRWTPDMELNPANTIIHFWNFDPLFCEVAGVPKALPFEGEGSFSDLVRKYAGDIPPGAMRSELIRGGAISEVPDKKLRLQARYFCPEYFDEDFVRNGAFALKNLGNTLIHNAALAKASDGDETSIHRRRFERFAWSDRLTPASIEAFKLWLRTEGARFIEQSDSWIGKNEVPLDVPLEHKPRAVGIGVYYFEEED